MTDSSKPVESQPTQASSPASGAAKDAKSSTAKVESKGYSNPALKAMGINRIKLPSRNWMIFLSVTGLLVGGALYDKREQKKNRDKWMKLAEEYGKAQISTNTTPRKVTVFVSPPPNDYLEESWKLFRRYIKPVLNSGGIDLEVLHSNTQGSIRNRVAADIRNLRREIEKNESEKAAKNEGLRSRLSAIIPGFITRPWNSVHQYFLSEEKKKKMAEEEETRQAQAFKKQMENHKHILGIYLNDSNKDQMMESHSEDSDNNKPLNNIGGVICIGRGTYKEYMLGLHEGLLGPLEKPERVVEAQAADEHRILDQKRKRDISRLKKGEELNEPDIKTVEELMEEVKANRQYDDKKSFFAQYDDPDDQDEEYGEYDFTREPIKAYLLPNEYRKEGKLAEEFKNYIFEDKPSVKIPTDDNVPPYYQQPICVMPVPHLLGFLTIPMKIYRFYNKRYVADELGELSFSVVRNVVRPFDAEKDLDLAVKEEEDWPKKWYQKSVDNDKDWVRDLAADKRVVSNLWVYDINFDKDDL